MARFQELDGASGKGKVVLDSGRVVMVHRHSSLILGITSWRGGGCSASSGNGLARVLQRQEDADIPVKGARKPSLWW
jgi:hypothetical protein